VDFEGERAHVRCPLPGEHVTDAALAAIASALALGLSLPEASAAVAGVDSAGRIRRLSSDTGATILDDRYNSSPASLAGALELLRGLGGRRLALLGKMAELGEHSRTEHERAGMLAASCADVLVTFGEDCRPLAEAAREAGLADVRWFPGRDQAASAVRRLLRPGDTVLVKGSRSEELEAVLPLLEGGP
jgi:UDP-N-acetylmuramoyl-tripeptide--D-alanyl-D-alanine ligase